MADDTIFHRIIRREIPADIVHEDEHVIAFRDISPQAPVHVLFVPKREIATLDDLVPDDAELVGRLVVAAAAYARREGLADRLAGGEVSELIIATNPTVEGEATAHYLAQLARRAGVRPSRLGRTLCWRASCAR